MSKTDKLIKKLRGGSSFTWNELKTLLGQLGWEKLDGGGSRVKFFKGSIPSYLHKPHPGNELKAYAKRDIIKTLEKEGDL